MREGRRGGIEASGSWGGEAAKRQGGREVCKQGLPDRRERRNRVVAETCETGESARAVGVAREGEAERHDAERASARLFRASFERPCTNMTPPSL